MRHKLIINSNCSNALTRELREDYFFVVCCTQVISLSQKLCINLSRNKVNYWVFCGYTWGAGCVWVTFGSDSRELSSIKRRFSFKRHDSYDAIVNFLGGNCIKEGGRGWEVEKGAELDNNGIRISIKNLFILLCFHSPDNFLIHILKNCQ